ncbi:histone deacetylase family protein [Sulfolobus sp. E5-1-F]|uniref:histone deacetylase family protein n=1 Tax=Saccharolobus sp. E5-1-F TaxID=2663019 RepID=UPI0012968184|nr:histone deacetylase family protein [Sulfolobus sp. E5-1-F]QGA55153.1 histone deacetylase family protein [Sulfolobus sp. E5-1-F]
MITIVYNDIYKYHASKKYHVENPNRIDKALSAINQLEVRFEKPIRVNDPQIVHSEDYVKLVEKHSQLEENLDADTYTNKYTYETALYALGGALKAFETNGFALVRPPGHHAGINGKAFGAPTLGFCIFNNIAYPIKKYKLKRVAIIDFDVHYGNGTQEIFYDDPDILHIDIHQDPRTIYPGTGFANMVGGKDAEGTKINLLIPPLGSDDLYDELIPIIQAILDDFKPTVIAYSAGFDSYVGDGLSSVNATEYTFYNFGIISNKFPRKYAVLEGGYDKGLVRGLKAFLEGFANVEIEYKKYKSTDAIRSRFMNYLSEEKQILRNYWSI